MSRSPFTASIRAAKSPDSHSSVKNGTHPLLKQPLDRLADRRRVQSGAGTRGCPRLGDLAGVAGQPTGVGGGARVCPLS
jgi:hypothetical protein